MITRFSNSLRRWIALVAMGVACISTSVQAAVTTIGAVPNAPPAGGGAVVGAFTIGDGAFGSVSVTAGTGITNTGGATIGNGVGGIGVVSLSGFDSDWTLNNAASDITLGDEGVGQITVSSSARLTVPDDTFIGAFATGNGKLVVTGLGSVYDTGDDFNVGTNGFGSVDVTSGGAVESDLLTIGDFSTGQGFVSVSGDLSRWTAGSIDVGDAGSGRLDVLSGGRVTSASTVDIGVGATSVGLVNVSGVGSTLSPAGLSALNIGRSGSGSLFISGGGRVTAGLVEMGINASGVGTLSIDGVGSRLDIAGRLNTIAGDANITISNGGVVSTTDFITILPGGRVTLDGGRLESTVNASISGILEGSGTMDIPQITLTGPAPKRLHTSAGDTLVLTGVLNNSFGLVDLAGGELDVRGVLLNSSDIDARDGATLRVGGAGLDNNSGSQLAITGGSVNVFGAVDNNVGAEIAVTGGSTATFHDAVINSGTIFVSASSEIVLLEDLDFVPLSALSVELAPITIDDDPTEAFGAVNVSGATALAGGLSVSLASGFTPTLGDTFAILNASGSLTGTFATESLPTLGGGLALDVQYTSDSVILEVVAAGIPGDFDFDGDVDGRDFLAWQRGESPNPFSAGDLAAWQMNYGNGALMAASVAVPEPSAWVVLIPGLALLFVARSPAR